MASTEVAKGSLFQEIVDLQTEGRRGTCTIGHLLENLEEDDRESLERAFADVGIKGPLITEVLKRRGFQVSSHTVQRHRRGGCGCS